MDGTPASACAGSPRHELVAADAGDLLGDVGLDRDVATPGRDDGGDHGLVGPGHDERLRLGRHRDRDRRAGAGSVSMPTRSSRSRCSAA